MKLTLITLISLTSLALGASAEKLVNFELSDQDEKTRGYRFPKANVTVMTVADHKGSAQLEPWIQQVYNRYGTRVDIDGIADVSIIPKPFHGMFRAAFRKELTRSVLLDWSGDVVKQFGYKKGVANIYVIDREGRIVARASGNITDAALEGMTREIDRVMKGRAQ